MKKLILAGVIASVLSTPLMAEDIQGDWVVTGGTVGSLHISCNASVANTQGNVSCDNNTVNINTGPSDFKDTDTQLSEAQVDAYTADNGYLTEHQDISHLATKDTTDKLKTKQVKLEDEIDIIRVDSTKRDDQLQAVASKNNLVSIAKDNNLQKQIQTQQKARIDGDEKTLNNAKKYADDNDQDTHRSDQSVIEATETVRTENLITAGEYADKGDTQVLSDAKTYADDNDSDTQLSDEDISELGYIKSYVDTDTDTHRSDESVVEATQEARDTLKGEVDTIIKEQGEVYSQELTAQSEVLTEAIEEEATAREQGDEETLESAKVYTDEGNAVQDVAISDNAQGIQDNADWNSEQDNRILRNEKDIKILYKGVAMASALGFGTNLATQDHDQRFLITPSIAYFKGYTALAVQTQFAINEHCTLRVGYSNEAKKVYKVKDGIIGGAVTFSF